MCKTKWDCLSVPWRCVISTMPNWLAQLIAQHNSPVVGSTWTDYYPTAEYVLWGDSRSVQSDPEAGKQDLVFLPGWQNTSTLQYPLLAEKGGWVKFFCSCRWGVFMCVPTMLIVLMVPAGLAIHPPPLPQFLVSPVKLLLCWSQICHQSNPCYCSILINNIYPSMGMAPLPVQKQNRKTDKILVGVNRV